MQLPAFRLVLLLGLAGCQPDIPEPIWKGEHLYYSSTGDGPVCRGSFYRQEQHAVELARLLGFELQDVIHYTRVENQDELAEYCDGARAKGCAHVDEPYAFGVRSFNFHEIAHVVANLGGVRGPDPFREGFAEVFADGGDPDAKQLPIRDVLRDFPPGDESYRTMGLFSRFLIERHGLDRFVQFLRSAAPDTSFAQFSPTFEKVFGESIEVAMTEFEDYPACDDMSNRIALVDCSLPLEPWDGRALTLTADVSCDRDDVLGPGVDDVMFTTRGFQVDEAGSYLFYASMPEGWSGFRVVKCGSCWDAFDVQIAPGAMESHELTPGRYYVLFGRTLDEPAELGLAVGQL